MEFREKVQVLTNKALTLTESNNSLKDENEMLKKWCAELESASQRLQIEWDKSRDDVAAQKTIIEHMREQIQIKTVEKNGMEEQCKA